MAETRPELCSCSALRQASRHLTRLYDEALAPLDLGLNQYSILAKIDRHGPQSLGALAALLVMDRSTLGHLIRPLERRGLVSIGVADRGRHVELTIDGAALMAAARPIWAVAERRFEDTFGADDALGLRRLLKRVTTVGLVARTGTIA